VPRRPAAPLSGFGAAPVASGEAYRFSVVTKFTANPRVNAYIDSLPSWQQDVCREVRELVHAADPEVTETIKRTKLPYFVLHGNVCALLAAKDHVNVFLYDGASFPIPMGSSLPATRTRPRGPCHSDRATRSSQSRW
jgi:hypothetical protein